MTKTHLVIPDPHAHPEHHNHRAEWLGKLINDVKPDVVINLGDQWDMPSLSSYDKGKSSFFGRRYIDDLNAGLDFQDRLWSTVRRQKKRMPRTVFLEGNHEYRLKKVLDYSSEYQGTISFSDFDLDNNYHDVVEYNGGTPGIIEVDGIAYAHYFTSGVMGRPIGGVHQASSMILKNLQTSVCGHTHTADWSVRTTPTGRKVHGLVAGVFQDYVSGWAGAANDMWWHGCVVLNDVEDGSFNPMFVSMDMLRKEYS